MITYNQRDIWIQSERIFCDLTVTKHLTVLTFILDVRLYESLEKCLADTYLLFVLYNVCWIVD